MRISDWSSDVCSSDFHAGRRRGLARPAKLVAAMRGFDLDHFGAEFGEDMRAIGTEDDAGQVDDLDPFEHRLAIGDSDHDPLHSGLRFSAKAVTPSRKSFVRINRPRSEEHTSELQSLMRISYAVF